MAIHFPWSKVNDLIVQLQGPVSVKAPEDLIEAVNQMLTLLGVDTDADTSNQEYLIASSASIAIDPKSFLDFPKSKSDIRSFETLQGNLVQFNFHLQQMLADLEQDLQPAFIRPEWRLVRAIRADFLRRCASVLVAMWTNFVQQIESNQGREAISLCFDTDSMDVDELDQSWRRSKAAKVSTGNQGHSASSPLDTLLQGRMEQALTLVPSRELARKLRMSDQKLRREIYLARQRAMAEGKTNGLASAQNATEPAITFTLDPPSSSPDPLPTPTPIPSSSQSDLAKAKTAETPRQLEMEPEVQTVEDDWMDVSTWLCSEIFEN